MYLPHLMPLAFLNNLMGMDGLVILVIGLLIFGRRLPEVGKNLGKTIVEFKKGLNGASATDDENAEQAASSRRLSGSKRNGTDDRYQATEDDQSDQPAPTRRLSSGARVSATARPGQRIPENEEV